MENVEVHPEIDVAEDLAVCLGVSSDLAFAAAITILNFSNLHPNSRTKFYLFSDKKLEGLLQPLVRRGLNIDSIVYEPPVSTISLWSSREIAYFSPLVLSKFEALKLLESHKKVLWLDYDIVIRKPLHELLSREEPVCFVGGGEARVSFHKDAPFTEGFMGKVGVNAGIMLFTSNFPNAQLNHSELYHLFEQNMSYIRLPEQAIFTLLFELNTIRPGHLDAATYCARAGKKLENEDPSVLHSPYKAKFWNGGPYSAEWQELYDEWISIGGRSFSSFRHEFSKSLRKVKYVLATALRMMGIGKPSLDGK